MRTIREGKAVISVPRQTLTKKAEAFYNPAMEYQRDVTVFALRAFSRERRGSRLSVCDPLAGTGVRGIRIAKEVPGTGRLLMNDANPKAFEVMWKNVEDNGLVDKFKIRLENMDAVKLFLEVGERFDYVDIDPFGSPVYFLPCAAQALERDSMLGCTATDTGALCGSFPSTCMHRYGVKAVKTDFFKETGVRVLITAVMMELARHDFSFTPLYAHANHYFRVIGRVKRKKSLLARKFKQVGFVFYCPHCLFRTREASGSCGNCGKKMKIIGPVWTGPLTDRNFCKKMLRDMKSHGYAKTRELETAVSEIDAPFYYDLHRLFRATGKQPKKTQDIMERLKSAGHEASRTHLCATGLMTSAPLEALLSLL